MHPSPDFDAGSSHARKWDASALSLGRLSAATTDEHYQLHLAAVEFEMSSPIIIETKEDILSQKHWVGRLDPFEHQIRNLITFCRRAPVALIADDVGLGKTISAGLILNELQTRKRVKRVLVLCPKVMLEQWKEELESKFGMPNVSVGVGQNLTNLLGKACPVLISTYESARDRIDLIRDAGFDMLVLDEAHKLRNLHGTNDPPKLAVNLYEALQRRTFRYVLMLTATPVQNGLWDIYSVVECLAAAKGHTNPLGRPTQFAAYYLEDSAGRKLRSGRKPEFRRKVQDYMVRTSRVTAGLSFPERRLHTVACQPRPDELNLIKLAGQLMQPLNGLTRVSVAEALLSSPRALLAQLRNMVGKGTISPGALAVIEPAIRGAGRGCKLDRVIDICRDLHQTNPTGWRLLVFTRRKETLALIAEALAQEGWTVGAIQGDAPAQNKQAIRGFWSDPPSHHVIVSTDAGAVGLNLQVCNALVNYDLPWNPMVLEQRIGRVQRLGSRFQYVVIWNLSVRGSIEDLIVVRLLEKLIAVSETLGDIESVLAASSYGDSDDFTANLRTLVMQALLGMDVSAALKKAEESIAKAREIYEKEKQAVDESLGAMDAMHDAGPRLPKLARKAPRLDVPTFCRRAFLADGGQVADLSGSRIRVSMPGRAPWIAAFQDDDALPDPEPRVFGAGHVLVYQEGSPQFERLTGEWRKRHSHRVLDRIEESRERVDEALQAWVADFGFGARVVRSQILSERAWFRGEVLVRATASVAHDRYEKLCAVVVATGEHREFLPSDGAADIDSNLHVSELAPDLSHLVSDAVESDSEILDFTRFYDARGAEEMQRAAGGKDGRREVASRFDTSLAAEAVGASGTRYASMVVDAEFAVDRSDHRYGVRLTLVPLARQVLAQPDHLRCEQTGSVVPAPWLTPCQESGRRVLAHLLERSPISGASALPEFFDTCQESGRRLLRRELSLSAVSDLRVGHDLLRPSEVSGLRALPRELAQCDFTGATVLPSELVRSQVSERLARSDQICESAVSGKRAHVSEFETCHVSGDRILADEGGRCCVTGSFVRRDLLVESERTAGRLGLLRDSRRCSVSNKLLLADEIVASEVSGAWVDRTLCGKSDVSGRLALPEEMLRCEATGAALLPDEAARSDATGRLVARELLVSSSVSERQALPEEMVSCGMTGVSLLPDELAISGVSHRPFRRDEEVVCAASGRAGHRSEFHRCDVTGAWLLPEETGVSALSGKRVRRDLLQASAKAPHRLGLAEEMATCDVSAKRLLRDEAEDSAVSGRLVDRDLLEPSAISGKRALPEELVKCQVTGSMLLPSETASSGATGRRGDARRLVRSEASGLQIFDDETGACEATGAVVFLDELGVSAATGRKVRRDQMVASALSGKTAHRSEVVLCEATGQPILPDETGTSSVSGKRVRKDLLLPSGLDSGRRGLASEFVLCAISGRQLLVDEAIRSALSGKCIDPTLGKVSDATGRVGLPEEFIRCEESGISILTDESDICAATGRRVDIRLLGKSDISGQSVLSRLLLVCPETKLRGQEVEFKRCAVTNLLVNPDALKRCTFENRMVLERLLVRSDVSGRLVLRDRAIRSAGSARVGHPDELRRCLWTGTQLLSDEVHECPLTSQWFSRAIPVTWGAAPLVDLVSGGPPSSVPPDALAQRVKAQLGSMGIGVRGLRLRLSPDRLTYAFLADASQVFGLRKRHVLGFGSTADAAPMHEPVARGRIETGGWKPDR